jgi:hypothetical protein
MSWMRCPRSCCRFGQVGEVGCMKHPTTKDRQIPIMLRAYFDERSVTGQSGDDLARRRESLPEALWWPLMQFLNFRGSCSRAHRNARQEAPKSILCTVCGKLHFWAGSSNAVS